MNDQPRVLLIEDDPAIRTLVTEIIGESVALAAEGSLGGARRALGEDPPDVILLDLGLPDGDGMSLLQAGVAAQVIVLSGVGEVARVVEAMRLGASDFVAKPFSPTRLRASLDQALRVRRLEREREELRRQVAGGAFEQIIGDSPAIDEARSFARDVADLAIPVLLEGESGTGKELFARAIHHASGRRAGRFVAINCAAMPETLLEAELFGNVKGAFTGATSSRGGLVEEAAAGTLFLDEVASANLALQGKLLRLLEQGTFRPVGGVADVAASCRFVIATNRNLADLVADGAIREDFYYRINRLKCTIPPLRARGEDVLLLAEHFVDRFAREIGKRLAGFTDGAIARLESYSWPGNIRELRNVVERAAITSSGPLVIESAILLEELRSPSPSQPTGVEPIAAGPGAPPAAPDPAPLDLASLEIPDGGLDLEALEKTMLRKALIKTRYNKTKAARLLGMTRSSFRYRLDKFGLDG